MQAEFPILSLILFSPLLGLVLACVFRDANDGVPAKVSALLSCLITFGLSVFLLTQFNLGVPGFQFVEKRPWIEVFGIHYYLGVDGFNLFFILTSALLTPLGLLAAWNMSNKVWQFQAQMMALQVGVFGSFLALDVFLFYAFFEVMLIPLYFLIGIWGGENRIHAAFKYFIYTMAGSLVLLVALVYTGYLYYASTGVWSFSINDWYTMAIPVEAQRWLFIGFALAFAIKTPMFPFHTWMPDVHHETPTIGAVELGGLLLKLGPYGFVRFVIPVFPDASQEFIPYMVGLSLVGILYGGMVAMVQPHMRRLMAYSTVSHLGFVILGLFVFTMNGLAGSVIQMINHAIAAAGLFLCIGMLVERTQSQEIATHGGVIKTMPILASFFLFFTMASIGLPGLNGFIGEILIMLGAAEFNVIYAIIAALGVIIAAIYMLRMYRLVMFGTVTNEKVRNAHDLNLREIVVLVPLAFITLAMGVYPQPFFERVNPTLTAYLEDVKGDEIQAASGFSIAKYLIQPD